MNAFIDYTPFESSLMIFYCLMKVVMASVLSRLPLWIVGFYFVALSNIFEFLFCLDSEIRHQKWLMGFWGFGVLGFCGYLALHPARKS